MAKYKITACWLLLAIMLLVTGVAFSVGETQARYQDRDTAVTVVKGPDLDVSSNCLVTKQDPPRTVLLGEMDLYGSMAVPFWMLSSEADATQKLNWGVADPDYAEFLNISVFVGYEQLQPKAELELLEDMKLDLMLCIEPTKLAAQVPHEAMKIPVHVTWGDEMWGTFQVILPEVLPAPDPEMMEDFWTEPETEATTEPVTEQTEAPETEETTEPATEPTEAPETTTEPVTESTEAPKTEATTEPVTESTEEVETEATAESTGETPEEQSLELAVEPGEPVTVSELDPEEILPDDQVTEPSTEIPTDATTEPSIEPTTEPTTEPVTEPVTEPKVELVADVIDMTGKEHLIQFKTLQAFHPSQLLPVRIELPEEVTTLRLGVQSVYGEHTYFEPFPDYTMFSLDGGASYYMLYGAYVPEFILENVTEIPMLLDFSYAKMDCSYRDLDEQEKMNLAMEVYVNDELFKTDSSAIVLSQEPSGMPILRPRVQQTEVAESEVITITNDTEDQLLGPILTFDNKLEFAFPVEWEEAELELKYSVELLTMTEEQKLEYVPVTLTKAGLNAIYIADEQMHKLVFRLGDRFVTPGTYRLNMTWMYEDVCYSDTQTTFFIHYSARTVAALSGQEVPNDN